MPRQIVFLRKKCNNGNESIVSSETLTFETPSEFFKYLGSSTEHIYGTIRLEEHRATFHMAMTSNRAHRREEMLELKDALGKYIELGNVPIYDDDYRRSWAFSRTPTSEESIRTD